MALREDRFELAGQMPHRKPAGDNRLDARLSHELGRLYFAGFIDQQEYEAGITFGNIALKYLEVSDGPEPYCADLQSFQQDDCLRRKLAFSAAHTVLKDAGNRCSVVVTRVAVYDEPARDDLERHALKTGLRALCGA